MTTTRTTTPPDYILDGTWHVPPVRAGQIIEVAYSAACDESECYWLRVTDGSDRSETYRRIAASRVRGEWNPANEEPSYR